MYIVLYNIMLLESLVIKNLMKLFSSTEKYSPTFGIWSVLVQVILNYKEKRQLNCIVLYLHFIWWPFLSSHENNMCDNNILKNVAIENRV